MFQMLVAPKLILTILQQNLLAKRFQLNLIGRHNSLFDNFKFLDEQYKKSATTKLFYKQTYNNI